MATAPNGKLFYFVREGFSGEPANDGWFSVEDCLPWTAVFGFFLYDQSLPVLVRLACGHICIAALNDPGRGFALRWIECSREGDTVENITHWRPLPPQPEGTTSETT
jgi:hypothetical protein